MTESANLRQNLQNIPSIFEITAAETLDQLIYPALSKIFDYFGLRLDFKLWGTLKINSEVLSSIVNWILQYLYLRNRGSSFGESFYGLQRTASATGVILSPSKQFASASLLTLLPYAERRLKRRIANHEDTHPWEKYVLKAFHGLHTVKAIQTFLYLIKYANSHSPIFRILGLTLRYPLEPPQQNKSTYIFLKLLEVLAFFLQFIEWWYSNEQRRKVGGSLKKPPPIKEPLEKIKKDTVPDGHCPVCLMKLRTPTASAISGYVYCWKCIASNLRVTPNCPVTGYPNSIDDLVRIFES